MAKGVTKDNIIIYPIGRKVAEKVAKMGLKSAGTFLELAEKPNSEECRAIAVEIEKMWLDNDIDRVEMFITTLRVQEVRFLHEKLIYQ